MPLVSLKLMAGVSNLQNDSFTTHQQSVNQSVKQKLHTSHSTSHSLHSHARDVQRVPRSQTRIRVAKPRVNPGSEPVQPPRLAGVWTVADTHTGMVWHGMVWYGLGLRLKASSSSEERSSSSWGRRGGGGGGGGGKGGGGGMVVGGVGGGGGGGGVGAAGGRWSWAWKRRHQW